MQGNNKTERIRVNFPIVEVVLNFEIEAFPDNNVLAILVPWPFQNVFKSLFGRKVPPIRQLLYKLETRHDETYRVTSELSQSLTPLT